MTEEQKSRIPEMRAGGRTYKEISEELGVPAATIKTFCRRNRLSPAKQISPEVNTRHCMNCGKKIEQIPGRKEKKFCSDACRMKWWNSHPDQLHRKTAVECRCQYCHRIFQAYERAGRKYCSHECYIADRFGGGVHD